MILVDEALWIPTGWLATDPRWRGQRWAHLASDTSYAELHAFAGRLGIPRRAFQGDHYDIPETTRERALSLGAQAVSSRELVRRLRAAGLRRRQRAVSSRARRPR